LKIENLSKLETRLLLRSLSQSVLATHTRPTAFFNHATFVVIVTISRLGSQILDNNLAASWEAAIYRLQIQKDETHIKPNSLAEHGLFLFYISDLLISVIFIL